jgi:hypothetical protein
MQLSQKNYLYIVLIHVFIGLCLYYLKFFPKMYGYGILLGGAFFVINSQNKNNEVLYAAAYIVGSEVVLRMTDGNPVYEFSKFGVMIFILIGIYYSGISKAAIPYWFFILLLIPGVIIGLLTLSYHASLRREISFNISGPVCLGLCSLYAYRRSITLQQLNNIILAVGLPIISCMIYLTLYTPSIKEIVTGTGSNAALSGGFGPNQVSTILGLGMFIFVSRLIYDSKTRLIFIINLIVAANIGFRGLVTFSRGGMLTGLVMIGVLTAVTYFQVNKSGKYKMNFLIAFVFVAMLATWTYSSTQTSGLINKRYANQDATGRVKEDQLTGRGELAEDEIATFLDHPYMGIGVARNQEQRLQRTGEIIVSHNEITRMLAEHGSLGILGLLILFITPLVLYLDNKYNIYILCFVAFWLLTINHAAMRIAAPAFIYSLSLLKIDLNEEKPVVHRE